MASSCEAAGAADDAAVPGEGEEGTLVAIRMRPLSSREGSRTWRVLQKHNSITQCTAAGKPLADRVQNRSFFTFDRTFGEASSTRQVYEQTSRGIVNSVANGLNGTIFAYGQTSSGKTYTMQGSGTLQEGAAGSGSDGGIVHMAASDIFNHIEKDPERVFLVRVSFIEIYNEEVRDLLVSGDSKNDATLAIREDKRRGVFVNSNENIVTSMDSLLSVLFAGEKNRSVAATGMNERSSRSHTIFKITVESRRRRTEGDGEEEEEDSDDEGDVMRGDENGSDGAVRVSTLNLVDLAGSESVRHTGATGDRQKEGGKINQSLLTLSRVIGSLGQNATHVNFRDSKLTRILQPSLSGNARMAVICCATPSELYLEETRSTLQFASRAKLVKTKAQVNEIMDDRSLIKKLQRELKEARRGGPGKEAMDQMKVLEEKAARDECALKWMKKLILNDGVLPGAISASGSTAKPLVENSLFVYNGNDETIKAEVGSVSLSRPKMRKPKRRYSDGVLRGTENGDPQQLHFSSPGRGGNISKRQARTETKPRKCKPTTRTMPSTEGVDIGLLQEALAAKSAQATSLKLKLNEALKQTQAAAEKLQSEHAEKEMHQLAKRDLESQVTLLALNKGLGLSEQDVVMEDEENIITTSLVMIENMLEERQQQATSIGDMQTLVDLLQGQLSANEEKHEHELNRLNEQSGRQKENDTATIAELERKLAAAVDSNTTSMVKIENMLEERQQQATSIGDMQTLVDSLQGQLSANEEKHEHELNRLNEQSGRQKENDTTKIAELERKLAAAVDSNTTSLVKIENMLEERQQQATSIEDMQTLVDSLQGQLSANEEKHEHELNQLNEQRGRQKENDTAKIAELERKLAAAVDSNTELINQVSSLEDANADAQKLLSEKKLLLEEAHSNMDAMKEEFSSMKSRLSNEVSDFRNAAVAAEERAAAVQGELDAEKTATSAKRAEHKAAIDDVNCFITQLTEENSSLQKSNENATKLLVEKEAALEKYKSDITALKDEASSATLRFSEEISELDNAKQAVEERLVTLENQLEATNASNTHLADQVTSLQNANGVAEEQVFAKEAALQEAKSEAAAAKEEASSALSQLSDEVLELRSAKQASEERVTTLEKSLEAEQLATKELEHRLGDAEDDVIRLTAENNTSNGSIQDLQSNLADITKEYNDHVKALQMAKESLEAATDANNILQTKYDSIVTIEQELVGNVSKLEATMQQRDIDIASLDKINTSLKMEVSTLSSKRDELATKVESTTADLVSVQEQLTGSVSEMENLQGKMEELGAECDIANNQVKELTSAMESNKEVMTALQQEKDELLVKLKKAELENDECLNEAEAAIDDKEKMLTEIEEVEAKLNCLKSDNDSLSSSLEKLKAEKTCLETEKKEAVSKLLAENTDLKSKLEASTAKCNAVELERKDCMHELEVATGENANFKGTITDLESSIVNTAKELQSSNNQIEQLSLQVSALTQERDKLETRVEEASSQVSTLAAKSDNAEGRLQELLSEKNESDKIYTENKALAAKVEEYIAQIDSERTNAQMTVNEMNKKIAELQGSLDASRTEVNDLLSQAEKSEANYKALESEKEKCLDKLRDELSTHVSGVEAECRETVANLQNALDEQSLNNQSIANSEAVDSMKKEIIDLKSLLSSANASVDEARSAALLADQERRIAEDKLRLAELSPRNSPARNDSEEELLRDMEVLMGEKLDAESRLEQELTRRRDAEDEMKKVSEEEKQLIIDEAENKMISLRDEISQLKSDLARVESDCYNMKDENADLQDKIKRVEAKAADSGSIATSVNVELARERDEKNLIQGDLDRLKEQSEAFKSQVFAAKDAFEAAAQEKLADAEDQLNEALSQLAKSRNDYNLSRETIADLNNDIEEYRRELDSVKSQASHEKEIELSKLREELAQTKANVSNLEANYASVKRDLESSKEKVDRVKRHEHKKQQEFANKAKETIMDLKDRLAKAEAVQKAAVASNLIESEVKSLQMEVKELTCTLQDKDARIKKLEKSKITKSQIANIQKMKDERNQYMAEAKEYKQMVEELENAKPRRSGLRERKDSSNPSQEIAKLKDDLRQCDRKLRKYVEHSERLENDRKGVIEAISSRNDVEIVGDSIADMVALLCEKLQSVEEECDALASSEGKAAEHLRNLDSLRTKYAALEHQVKNYEENDAKLTGALVESKDNLAKAKEQVSSFEAQIKSMSAAKENISEVQSEHRHQLQQLSNENLDLGRQLESTKKELAEAKAELGAVGRGKMEEQTEELQGLSKVLGSSVSSKRVPVDPRSNRPPPPLSGSKRIPLGPSRERLSESSMTTKGTLEKENLLNKKQRLLSTSIQSPFRSAKKKKSINPFSSAKKISQQTLASQKDGTQAKQTQYVLGDSEPTADVTGECQQS